MSYRYNPYTAARTAEAFTMDKNLSAATMKAFCRFWGQRGANLSSGQAETGSNFT